MDDAALAGESSVMEPEQWFFFCRRSLHHSGCQQRVTPSGYWKAAGSKSWVFSSHNRVIAEKRILVFYEGREGNGTRTMWKMNTYDAVPGQVRVVFFSFLFIYGPIATRDYYVCVRT